MVGAKVPRDVNENRKQIGFQVVKCFWRKKAWKWNKSGNMPSFPFG